MVEYTEQLKHLDEQFCALLKQRTTLTGKQIALPPEKLIAEWAEEHGLYEEFIKGIFNVIELENHFRPRVEPVHFRKHLAVMQSIEMDDYFYSLTLIRQYENASVVHLHIDWDGANDTVCDGPQYPYFELQVGERYDCWPHGGSGTTGHATQEFVVAPALPDDLAEINFLFSGYDNPIGRQVKTVEFLIRVQG